MPVLNPGFETAGAAPGQAASWTLISDATPTDVATPDATAEGREDFEEGWRFPMPTPGRVNMGTWTRAGDLFADGAAIADATARPILYAVVTTAPDNTGDITLTVTYTDAVSGAGRVGTATIPPGAPVNSSWPVDLQGVDSAPLDVTAATGVGVGGVAGVARIDAVRQLLQYEGFFGARESGTEGLNETALFALGATDAADFAHGLPFEHFEFAWNGNDGTIHNDFEAEPQEAGSLDLVPALASAAEPVEDFEEGWYTARTTATPDETLGSYRISNNAFVNGTTAVANGPVEGLPSTARPRARVTEAFGGIDQVFDVTYLRYAADAPQIGTVRIPGTAQVGQLYGLTPSVSGDTRAHDVTAIAEQVDRQQLGRFDIEVDELPAAADMTTGVRLESLNARLVLGAGTGAVTYEARAVGLAGEVVRVWHRALAATAITSVAVAGNDVTVSLRTSAANAVLATAQEVADAFNATPDASALASATAAGTGVTASNLGLTALDALMDAAAASFDFGQPSGAEAFEDFEDGWAGVSGTMVLENSFPLIGTPPGPHAYDGLRAATFGVASDERILAQYDAGTNIFTDVQAMPAGTSSSQVAIVVGAPLFVAAGDFVVRVTYNGPLNLDLPDEVLTGVTRLGTTIQAAVTALTDVTTITEPGGLGSFTAGLISVLGAVAAAETFESGWTLAL